VQNLVVGSAQDLVSARDSGRPPVGEQNPVVISAQNPIVDMQNPIVSAQNPVVGVQDPVSTQDSKRPLVGIQDPVSVEDSRRPPVGAQDPVVTQAIEDTRNSVGAQARKSVNALVVDPDLPIKNTTMSDSLPPNGNDPRT